MSLKIKRKNPPFFPYSLAFGLFGPSQPSANTLHSPFLSLTARRGPPVIPRLPQPPLPLSSLAVEPTGRKTPLPRSPCPAPHPFESHARPSRLPLPHFISPHLCSTPCVQQNRRRRPPRSTRRTEPSPLKLVTLVSSASPRALPDQVSRVLVPSSVLAASTEEPAMAPPRFSAPATSPTVFMAGNGLASLFSLPSTFGIENRAP